MGAACKWESLCQSCHLPRPGPGGLGGGRAASVPTLLVTHLALLPARRSSAEGKPTAHYQGNAFALLSFPAGVPIASLTTPPLWMRSSPTASSDLWDVLPCCS